MFLASMALFMLGRAQRAMGGSAFWSTLAGIVSLVLAVSALARPGAAVASVIVLIAWFALAIGLVNLVVAFRVRALTRAVVIA